MRNQREIWTQASASEFLDSFYASLRPALSAEGQETVAHVRKTQWPEARVQAACGRQDTKFGETKAAFI